MIVGMDNNSSALDVLKQSAFKFYLGGSRRMAQRFEAEYGLDTDDFTKWLENHKDVDFVIRVTEDTDYDFYATYSTGVESYLFDNGFTLSEANEYYLDSECMVIYKRDNVQVVLRRDAEFYQTVFENIDLKVYYHFLWKSSPVKPNRELIGPFFNMLFKIAHATKGAQ